MGSTDKQQSLPTPCSLLAQIKRRHLVTEDGEPDGWAADVVLLEHEPQAVMDGARS